MISPCDQVKVSLAIVVCGVGGVFVVKNGEPVAVEDERSVRTSFATRIAPSTFNSPAPCSSILKVLSGWAVYIKRALTIFGVSLGLACSKRAAAPDTTGVAIEVPLRYIMRLLSSSVMPE